MTMGKKNKSATKEKNQLPENDQDDKTKESDDLPVVGEDLNHKHPWPFPEDPSEIKG